LGGIGVAFRWVVVSGNAYLADGFLRVRFRVRFYIARANNIWPLCGLIHGYSNDKVMRKAKRLQPEPPNLRTPEPPIRNAKRLQPNAQTTKHRLILHIRPLCGRYVLRTLNPRCARANNIWPLCGLIHGYSNDKVIRNAKRLQPEPPNLRTPEPPIRNAKRLQLEPPNLRTPEPPIRNAKRFQPEPPNLPNLRTPILRTFFRLPLNYVHLFAF
jgi:hypothetical protein